MGRDTREKIMLTAIDMFNKKGATNVSTVQLSNELHISPGNLYYYFDNKEHVIRSIWLEMLAPKIEELFYQKALEQSVEGLMTFFLQLSRYTFSYKFFYLELPAMLNNDSALKKLYKERALRLMEKMEHLIQGWSESGMMKPIPPIAKKLLVENCWTLSQTGITYVNMLDADASPKETSDSIIQKLYALLYPYFSDESHEKLLQLFAQNDLSFDKYA